MPAKPNPKTGFISKPTSTPKPTRPGVPDGKGNVTFANGGKTTTKKVKP